MEYVWLCLSAVAAGMVNAVAGGGTLLTYAALTSVVAPHVANGTSTVALFPGTFASVWGYRRLLPACRHWILWLTPPSIVGGLIGACLVDEVSFPKVIPYLILLAAVLFLLQPTLARLFKRQAGAAHAPSPGMLAVIIVVQFSIGIYGGYFGAGIGILMLSSLSFLGLKDIHETNALKSFLAFNMNIVAAGVFSVRGFLNERDLMVDWRYAAAMALAAIVGGYLGARWSLLLRPVIVRWIIIAIGFGLAVHYFV